MCELTNKIPGIPVRLPCSQERHHIALQQLVGELVHYQGKISQDALGQ